MIDDSGPNEWEIMGTESDHFRRDIFPVGPEALDVALDRLFHHINGLLNGFPVGDTALEGGDNSGESPFRFLPQENTVTDLVHKDHPNRIIRMNRCSL